MTVFSCCAADEEAASAHDDPEKGAIVQKQPTIDYCAIDFFSPTARPGSHRCRGCERLKNKIPFWFRQPQADRVPLKLHTCFAELQGCAEQCGACRIFRRALLLRQSSDADTERLLTRDADSAITVVLHDGSADTAGSSREKLLFVQVGQSNLWTDSAFVAYTETFEDHPPLPQSTLELQNAAKKWLEVCRADHPLCGNLAVSVQLPTRLIQILNEDTLKLVETNTDTSIADYVAISYCWGPDASWNADILAGETRDSNYDERLKSFPIGDLPQALQDAVILVHRMGMSHVWIDAVCIIQKDNDFADFRREAPKMARVYGNAGFTLSLGSSKSATESLMKPQTGRVAWQLNASNVRLGQKLVNVPTTLDDARDHSPLSERAWTLQEEYLSPRRLYWFNHSLYWACAESTRAEGGMDDALRPSNPVGDGVLARKYTEKFLAANFQQDLALLHEEWSNIAESFTLRSVGSRTDKFKAIAGVAARYFQPETGDQYLAGIWKNNIAQELSWGVAAPRNLDESFWDLAPSWSWMSLPLNSRMAFKRDLKQCEGEAFKLQTASTQEDDAETSIPPALQSGMPLGPDEVEDIVRAGENIKSIRIQGRVRPLWNNASRVVPWSDVHDHENRFAFGRHAGTAVRTADSVNGTLEVAEAGRQPIRGQMDYTQHCERLMSDDLLLYGLQIGEGAMLLLERTEEDSYQRIGFADCFNRMFFDNLAVTSVKLV